MNTHILRIHIVAVVKRDIAYDPANIASYTEALSQADTIRQAVKSAGAELVRDTCEPKVVRK